MQTMIALQLLSPLAACRVDQVTIRPSASGASLRHKLKPGGAKGESEMSSRVASPSKGVLQRLLDRDQRAYGHGQQEGDEECAEI